MEASPQGRLALKCSDMFVYGMLTKDLNSGTISAKRCNMSKLWELFERGIIFQGLLVLMISGTYCYVLVMGQAVPGPLLHLLEVIVGFFFGARAVVGPAREVKAYLERPEGEGEGPSKFWDLLERSVLFQGALVLMLAGTYCYLVAMARTAPDALLHLLQVIVGFFFGAKAAVTNAREVQAYLRSLGVERRKEP